MSDNKSVKEIKKEITKEIPEEIVKEEKIIADRTTTKRSYKPTEDSLDTDNPPNGGSGIPEKKED